jgi:MerR HTH family regulatory protein
MEYSLSHIAASTGLKPRTVQVWAEAGAIRPKNATDRRGTGVHRRFSFEEAMIACILAPLSKTQMSIGALIEVAGNVRSNMGLLRPGFIDALNNSTPHILVIHWFDREEEESGEGSGGITCEILPPDKLAAALAPDGEIATLIQLHLVLAGLRRFK